ncbi:hypothetical protein H8356DRAFT_1308595 [Neocallimastix lanati (nom. inval.)]|jgi:hypothetical protein|uniref:Uncharacterized protein n=1 Tax=Neocallimastix californiae TaxID=1754190 RepID=A0A1Y2AGN4_9FUNG|nr:hypothetical protein H8356DRAFT_1308595 [Neocallimastix sp. JGI-2020a]ORY21721.1 hypothetical protein LY90DRAFT_390520 [Neocallimastix californiae]|eukprot:ORY21721.1 hypothetical protein LY90DRAFT_390520 [Neocallimastix californiae]
MVVIHVKRNEKSMFLYENLVSTPISELVPVLVNRYNLINRVGRLVQAGRELVLYGPLKPYDQHGLTEEQINNLDKKKNSNEIEEAKIITNDKGFKVAYRPDPTGRRNGEAPIPETAKVIEKALDEAEQLISKDKVAQGIFITDKELNEAIQNVKGAVMIAYPMGIPSFDPVQEIIDDNEDLSGSADSKEVLDPKTSTLWWAGKELKKDKKLSDYLGRNEKTKIIAKLQKANQGAPVREAPLSEQEQKNLMAYYYKKQEELKKLEENDDDDYLASEWANPRALKSAFSGIKEVSWRGFK